MKVGPMPGRKHILGEAGGVHWEREREVNTGERGLSPQTGGSRHHVYWR